MSECCGNYPLTIKQGAEFTLPTIFKRDGVVVDVTDYTAILEIRQDYGADPLITLTTENDGIVVDGPSGSIMAVITSIQTAAFPAPFVGIYDFFITPPAGDKQPYLTGQVNVNPGVIG